MCVCVFLALINASVLSRWPEDGYGSIPGQNAALLTVSAARAWSGRPGEARD